MGTTSQNSSTKKRTNLTLNSTLLKEAKALGVNISQSAEIGIANAVRLQKQKRWLEENREAIEGSNQYVEEHGLPLRHFRKF